MALRDYRLCDVCGCKTFYDANLDVSAVGALVVLCQDCAKTHVLRIYAQDEADSGFDGKSWVDLMGLSQRLRARAIDAETEVANLQRKLETTNNGILYALRSQTEETRRAEQAEARLRTATETLRQIIEWSSDANYGAGMIDIERAARDGLALITGERQP